MHNFCYGSQNFACDPISESFFFETHETVSIPIFFSVFLEFKNSMFPSWDNVFKLTWIVWYPTLIVCLKRSLSNSNVRHPIERLISYSNVRPSQKMFKILKFPFSRSNPNIPYCFIKAILNSINTWGITHIPKSTYEITNLKIKYKSSPQSKQ
jgi:hypothetical protein